MLTLLKLIQSIIKTAALVEPVKRQIVAVQAEATERVHGDRQRLDQVEKQLQAS